MENSLDSIKGTKYQQRFSHHLQILCRRVSPPQPLVSPPSVMSVFDASPGASSARLFPPMATVGDDHTQTPTFVTNGYQADTHPIEGSGGAVPPSHPNKNLPSGFSSNMSSTSACSWFQFFLSLMLVFTVTQWASSHIAFPSDGPTISHLSSSSSSSDPPPPHRLHEYRPIPNSVSNEEVNKHLDHLGHNHYLCTWALCPQHRLLGGCDENCQWLYCRRELHNSKENARVHVRQDHYGISGTFYCIVW